MVSWSLPETSRRSSGSWPETKRTTCTAGSLADELDAVAEAKAYLDSLPKVDRNEFDLRRLRHDVEADVKTLRDLHDHTEAIGENDGKLAQLKELLAGDLKGKKVLIFSTFKDTSRYVYRKLTSESNAGWLKSVGDPNIRRIDSGNHPNERPHMLGRKRERNSPVARSSSET